MADYLELFAYWQWHTAQSSQPVPAPAWHETCFEADGQGRSVVLGLARAIVEVPGFFRRTLSSNRDPFRVYAAMEAGTQWQWIERGESGKRELMFEIGS